MSGEKTTNELIRVALPARLVTVRRFLEALDADELDPETMVLIRTSRGGQQLVIEEPVHPHAQAVPHGMVHPVARDNGVYGPGAEFPDARTRDELIAELERCTGTLVDGPAERRRWIEERAEIILADRVRRAVPGVALRDLADPNLAPLREHKRLTEVHEQSDGTFVAECLCGVASPREPSVTRAVFHIDEHLRAVYGLNESDEERRRAGWRPVEPGGGVDAHTETVPGETLVVPRMDGMTMEEWQERLDQAARRDVARMEDRVSPNRPRDEGGFAGAPREPLIGRHAPEGDD